MIKAIPRPIRDQAIVLGSKLLIAGNGPAETRADMYKFIKASIGITPTPHQLDSVMIIIDAVRNIRAAGFDAGYEAGRQDAINEGAYAPELDDTSAHPQRTIMTRKEVIVVLIDCQLDAFRAASEADKEDMFLNGYSAYDDYDDAHLLTEYNEIVDECNQIDEIVD